MENNKQNQELDTTLNQNQDSNSIQDQNQNIDIDQLKEKIKEDKEKEKKDKIEQSKKDKKIETLKDEVNQRKEKLDKVYGSKAVLGADIGSTFLEQYGQHLLEKGTGASNYITKALTSSNSPLLKNIAGIASRANDTSLATEIGAGIIGGGGGIFQGGIKGISSTSKLSKLQRQRQYEKELGGWGKAYQGAQTASLAMRGLYTANLAKNLTFGAVGGLTGGLGGAVGSLAGGGSVAKGLVGGAIHGANTSMNLMGSGAIHGVQSTILGGGHNTALAGILPGLRGSTSLGLSPLAMGLIGTQIASSIAVGSKLRKLKTVKKSNDIIEREYSLSKYTDPMYKLGLAQNELRMPDQLEYQLLSFIEGHTSVLPSIYNELNTAKQDRDKGSKRSELSYDEKTKDNKKSILNTVTDQVSLLFAKYDPSVQLLNAIVGKISPHRFIEQLKGETASELSNKEIKKISKSTGLNIDAVKLLTIKSSNLINSVHTYEEKMLMLTAGIYDINRLIGQESINIRSQGFGITSSNFVAVDEKKTLSQKIGNVITNIPGIGAIANVIHDSVTLMGKIGKGISGITNKIPEIAFGKKFLTLANDREALDKEAGIYKSSKEKSIDFIAEGLPNLIEKIRSINISQLEMQSNIFSVIRDQYSLLYKVYTGKDKKVDYIESLKSEKEERIWDYSEKLMLSAEKEQEALQTREDKRTAVLEDNFSGLTSFLLSSTNKIGQLFGKEKKSSEELRESFSSTFEKLPFILNQDRFAASKESREKEKAMEVLYLKKDDMLLNQFSLEAEREKRYQKSLGHKFDQLIQSTAANAILLGAAVGTGGLSLTTGLVAGIGGLKHMKMKSADAEKLSKLNKEQKLSSEEVSNILQLKPEIRNTELLNENNKIPTIIQSSTNNLNSINDILTNISNNISEYKDIIVSKFDLVISKLTNIFNKIPDIISTGNIPIGYTPVGNIPINNISSDDYINIVSNEQKATGTQGITEYITSTNTIITSDNTVITDSINQQSTGMMSNVVPIRSNVINKQEQLATGTYGPTYSVNNYKNSDTLADVIPIRPNIDLSGTSDNLKKIKEEKKEKILEELNKKQTNYLQSINENVLKFTDDVKPKGKKKGLFDTLFGMIKDGIGTLFSGIGSLATAGAGALGNILGSAFAGASGWVANAIAATGGVGALAVPAILITGGVRSILDFVSGWKETDGGILSKVWGGIKHLFLGSKEGGLGSAVSGAAKYAALGFAAGSVVPVLGNITGMLIGGAVGAIIDGLGQNRLSSIGNWIQKWIGGGVLIDAIWKDKSSLANRFGNIGTLVPGVGYILGLSGGIIGSAFDYILDAFKISTKDNKGKSKSLWKLTKELFHNLRQKIGNYVSHIPWVGDWIAEAIDPSRSKNKKPSIVNKYLDSWDNDKLKNDQNKSKKSITINNDPFSTNYGKPELSIISESTKPVVNKSIINTSKQILNLKSKKPVVNKSTNITTNHIIDNLKSKKPVVSKPTTITSSIPKLVTINNDPFSTNYGKPELSIISESKKPVVSKPTIIGISPFNNNYNKSINNKFNSILPDKINIVKSTIKKSNLIDKKISLLNNEYINKSKLPISNIFSTNSDNNLTSIINKDYINKSKELTNSYIDRSKQLINRSKELMNIINPIITSDNSSFSKSNKLDFINDINYNSSKIFNNKSIINTPNKSDSLIDKYINKSKQFISNLFNNNKHYINSNNYSDSWDTEEVSDNINNISKQDIHIPINKLIKNKTLDGVKPFVQERLGKSILEYQAKTNTKEPVQINSGYRSIADQVKLYEKYGPGRAAIPGKSMHNFGLAVDMQSSVLNKMDKYGILQRNGLYRPFKKEPWHVEPIGLDRKAIKKTGKVQFNSGIDISNIKSEIENKFKKSINTSDIKSEIKNKIENPITNASNFKSEIKNKIEKVKNYSIGKVDDLISYKNSIQEKKNTNKISINKPISSIKNTEEKKQENKKTNILSNQPINNIVMNNTNENEKSINIDPILDKIINDLFVSSMNTFNSNILTTALHNDLITV